MNPSQSDWLELISCNRELNTAPWHLASNDIISNQKAVWRQNSSLI
jgi:hypothetical protein